MSSHQENFPSNFRSNDAFYENLEENTFVAFIMKHPVDRCAFMPEICMIYDWNKIKLL